MRRLVPWALLVLLGLGVGLGAALGAAASPGTPRPTPVQWVDGVLATTKAAGTARLAFSSVTASNNPDLRGSSSGTGAVDFAAQTMRTTEVQHQIEWSVGQGGVIDPHPQALSESAIGIGPTLYQSLAPVGIGYGLHVGWLKQSIPRGTSALGLANGAASALLPLTGPFTVLSVRDLGQTTLDGTAATRYLVRSELQSACPRRAGKQAVLPQVSASEFTTVWIDDKGRLVQARSTTYDSGKIPAALLKATPEFADRPMGSSTITTTLRFSAFGAPLHISVPPATEGISGSSIALSLRCASS